LLVSFIDAYRDRFGGVEPICRVLCEHGWQIAPSGKPRSCVQSGAEAVCRLGTNTQPVRRRCPDVIPWHDRYARSSTDDGGGDVRL
jgi:hypothetical protein